MRRRPLYEVVGQLGMWGTIINGIQASALEHKQWKESTWSGENSMSLRPSILGIALYTGLSVGLLVAYTSGAHFVATWVAWH